MKNSHSITRRKILALWASAVAVSAARPALAKAVNPVVVELFTSQGCSSCPPADVLLDELRAMPGLVAISYHVDYWDYLGWKDTLASPENSQRQYDYAKARGDMDVYTPQMIINGASHHVGSQRQAVLGAIAAARETAFPVTLSIHGTPKEIIVRIDEGQPMGEATIWLMPLLRQATVKILKGEIAGREMTYHNIVREVLPAGMWSGKAVELVLPKDAVLQKDATSCVALLQTGKTGPLLGCAVWGQIGA